MKQLPEHVQSYKQTKRFNQSNVPKGLLQNHNTAEGVWGKIVIVSGRLNYTIHSPQEETIQLSPEQPGVVEPEIPHHVSVVGDVEFYVEFYR